MRPLAAALLCGLALMATACGSSGTGSGGTQAGSGAAATAPPETRDPPAPAAGATDDVRADVERTLERYYAAFLAGDGAQACTLLTDEAEEQLLSLDEDDRPGSCAEAIERFGASLGTQPPEQIAVEVTGTSATATVRFDRPPATQELRLVRDGDAWKIVSQRDA